MTVPGFTAEVSLYRTSGHFHASRTHGESGGAIRPAQAAQSCINGKLFSKACSDPCLQSCQTSCKQGYPYLTGSSLGACLNACKKTDTCPTCHYVWTGCFCGHGPIQCPAND
jgi:hypothetical protein